VEKKKGRWPVTVPALVNSIQIEATAREGKIGQNTRDLRPKISPKERGTGRSRKRNFRTGKKRKGHTNGASSKKIKSDICVS